ncbi:MAG: alpha/beta hydrolase [Rhodocyclaceae bacterium]
MQLRVQGEPLYAYTGGRPFDASLPAVVFVHGAQLDHSVWSLQSRYFAHHGHCVLAVDLPGHGRSGGSALASIAAIADWIAALLDCAGLDRASLIGHSMGSLAALCAASRHADRVQRIALIGTAVPMPVSRSLLEAARSDEPRAIAMINAWSHSPRAHIGGNTAPGMWMYGTGRRLMERAASGVLHTDLAACNDFAFGAQDAARVKCPVLILSGTRDQMTAPRSARAVAALLPQARLLTIEGAGHSLMAEQPDRVLDALREFL